MSDPFHQWRDRHGLSTAPGYSQRLYARPLTIGPIARPTSRASDTAADQRPPVYIRYLPHVFSFMTAGYAHPLVRGSILGTASYLPRSMQQVRSAISPLLPAITFLFGPDVAQGLRDQVAALLLDIAVRLGGIRHAPALRGYINFLLDHIITTGQDGSINVSFVTFIFPIGTVRAYVCTTLIPLLLLLSPGDDDEENNDDGSPDGNGSSRGRTSGRSGVDCIDDD